MTHRNGKRRLFVAHIVLTVQLDCEQFATIAPLLGITEVAFVASRRNSSISERSASIGSPLKRDNSGWVAYIAIKI